MTPAPFHQPTNISGGTKNGGTSIAFEILRRLRASCANPPGSITGARMAREPVGFVLLMGADTRHQSGLVVSEGRLSRGTTRTLQSGMISKKIRPP